MLPPPLLHDELHESHFMFFITATNGIYVPFKMQSEHILFLLKEERLLGKHSIPCGEQSLCFHNRGFSLLSHDVSMFISRHLIHYQNTVNIRRLASNVEYKTDVFKTTQIFV